MVFRGSAAHGRQRIARGRKPWKIPVCQIFVGVAAELALGLGSSVDTAEVATLAGVVEQGDAESRRPSLFADERLG